MTIAQIAVSAATFAIDKPYSYRVPQGLDVAVGMRVLVPFGRGNKRSEGIVLDITQEPTSQKLKEILALLDERPVLDADGVKLALWLRKRCFSTVYGAVRTMLPTGLWYTLRDSYQISHGISREEAFEAAGKSKAAKRIIEVIFANGGAALLEQILGAVEQKNPKPMLSQLVKDGILELETGAKRKVNDKTEKVAALALPPGEAMDRVKKREHSAPMRYSVTQLLCTIGSSSVKEICYFTGASLATIKSLEKSGIITLTQQEVFRRALPETKPEIETKITLNEEQKSALEGLHQLSQSKEAKAALLYGVTGSGKTQVYISLIYRLLTEGKTALILVPEIALTMKLLELFVAHFGRKVAILHSGLPAGERYDEWKRVRDGEAPVVLGTRSAVFAPLKNLGLIVLDEEQEGSYQAENMLRYHARDVAKFRCAQQNALLLLGSATPAVESMQAAQSGDYHLFTLTKRYNEKALPSVFIADMKQEIRAGNSSGLSGTLLEELDKNLVRGEQSILFLNRRGSSRMLSCTSCGEVPSCPRCSVYLTHHGANGRLMCHYCGHSQLPERNCTECGGAWQFIGAGTQKIQAELEQRYPDIEIMRMDTDTVTAARSHEALLERFQRKKIPILVGTQMVAKGLDFENVTLVGVIAADVSLYVDSFRAAERTFSLLTQVVGRAGRGEKPGRAVIQTWTPDNEIITLAARQDYDTFFQRECAVRKLRHFPPFSDLFRLTVAGLDEAAVLRVCMNLKKGLDSLSQQLQAAEHYAEIFGPAPAGVLKVNQRYRYQITLNTKNTNEVRNHLAALLQQAQADPATRDMTISVDLNSMD